MQSDSPAASGNRSLLGMMHLRSCLLMGFAVVLGEAIASQIIPAQAAFGGFMTGFLLFGAYMVLDDLGRKIDSDNQRSKITLVGDVKRNEALSFALVLASVGLLFAAYLGPSTLLIALLSVVVIFVHHAKARKNYLLGNTFVGANTAITFIYAGFAVGSLTRMLAIFVMMAFLSSMGREAIKILAQPLKHSVNPQSDEAINRSAEAGGQSAVLFVATVVLSIVPPVLGLVSINYFPLIVICDVGFLLTAYSMVTSPTSRNAKRNMNYVPVWLSFGLFAFVIGTI